MMRGRLFVMNEDIFAKFAKFGTEFRAAVGSNDFRPSKKVEPISKFD